MKTPVRQSITGGAVRSSSSTPGFSQNDFSSSLTIFRRKLRWLLILLGATLLARPCAATPGEWDFTNNLNAGRYRHAEALLQNGMVLVVGGSGSTGSLLSAELYDSITALWSTTGSLS